MSNVTIEQAQRAITAALRAAEENGVPSSVAVVDSGRNLVAFARMEGALLASIEISQNKAYTARSMNSDTGALQEYTQPGAPFYGLETSHGRPLITFGGGLPITASDGEVVGAVGVAGGSADQDAAVAHAAVDAIAQAVA
jgi:uncharacterized protein GlcG (DUF336 family)